MATISKDSHHKGINRVLFDIVDDHNDPIQYTEQGLSRYFVSASIPSIINRDEKAVVIDDNDGDGDGDGDDSDDDDDDEDMNDDHLSQKMSQLSMMNTKRQISMSSTTDMMTKKLKLSDQSENDEKEKKNDSIATMDNNNNKEKEDEIPDYLLTTNPLFDHRIKKVLDEMSTISLDELRQIAVIKHHLGVLDQQKRLFLMYHRSGKGTLEENTLDTTKVDRHYWPNEVKSMKQTSENKEDTCENVLRQRLENLDHKIGKYQNELENLKCQCAGLTTLIEEALDSIVNRHGIEFHRKRSDMKIVLLKYEYDTTMLERQFRLEKPSNCQITSAHRLYEVRFEYEKARRILMEVKQSVFEHRIPKEFHAKILSMIKSHEPPPEFSSCNSYEQMIHQHITDFIATRVANAEQKYDQCRKRMHAAYEEVWKRHHDGINGCVMSKSIIDMIERQLILITDRWRAIYDYRMNIYIDAEMLK